MYIKSYYDFILESNIKFPLLMSDRFINIIYDIDSIMEGDNIAKQFISDFDSKPLSSISMIDTEQKNNISYVQSNRVRYYMNGDINYTKIRKKDFDQDLWKKGSQLKKISLIINDLYPNIFTADEIEKFTYKYIACISSNKIIIVDSSKSDSIYNTNNYIEYHDSCSHRLCNSCMNNEFKHLQLFKDNPKKINFIVLLKENKISARAILWRTDNNIFLMDVVYYHSMSDYYELILFCTQNNIVYRETNKIDHYIKFIVNNKVVDLSLKVTLSKNIESYGKNIPYIDTFVFGKDNVISNKPLPKPFVKLNNLQNLI